MEPAVLIAKGPRHKFQFGIDCVRAWYETAAGERIEDMATVQKAVEKGDVGRMVVEGVASDNLLDSHDDRMADQALQAMAKQAKSTRNHDGLPLLDNHHSTFEFGRSFDGFVDEMPNGVKQLRVLFALDPEYPQSRTLFREVMTKTSRRQLSIGGMLDLSKPGTIKYELDRGTGKQTRVIQAIDLEHIAATRPTRAANARTGFLAAMMKSLDDAGLAMTDLRRMADDLIGSETPGVSIVPVWKSGAWVPAMDSDGPDPAAEVFDMGKTAVSFVSYRLNDGSPWSFSGEDGNKLIERGGWALFKAAHTAVRGPGTPEVKDVYALPHTKIDTDGAFKTFLRGVRAAAGALLGARGGVQGLSDDDRKGAARHLLRHYAEFKEQPPARLQELAKGTRAEIMNFEDFCAESLKVSPGFLLTKEEVEQSSGTMSEVLSSSATIKDAGPGNDRGSGQEDSVKMISKCVQGLEDVLKGIEDSPINDGPTVLVAKQVLGYLLELLTRAAKGEANKDVKDPVLATTGMSEQLRTAMNQALAFKELIQYTDDEMAAISVLVGRCAALRKALADKAEKLASAGTQAGPQAGAPVVPDWVNQFKTQAEFETYLKSLVQAAPPAAAAAPTPNVAKSQPADLSGLETLVKQLGDKITALESGGRRPAQPLVGGSRQVQGATPRTPGEPSTFKGVFTPPTMSRA